MDEQDEILQRGPEVAMSSRERQVIQRAARLEGRSITNFLRHHGARVAMEVIARESASRPDLAA